MLEILTASPPIGGGDTPNLVPAMGFNFGTNLSTSKPSTTSVYPPPPLVDGERYGFGKYGKVAAISAMNSANPISALSMGKSDYTFEAWINVDATGQNWVVFSATFASNINFSVFFGGGSDLQIATDRTWSASTFACEKASINTLKGKATHIAVVRKAEKMRVYINGKLERLKTASTWENYVDEVSNPQAYTWGSGTSAILSERSVLWAEFAWHKVAKYSGDFTPPLPLYDPSKPDD